MTLYEKLRSAWLMCLVLGCLLFSADLHAQDAAAPVGDDAPKVRADGEGSGRVRPSEMPRLPPPADEETGSEDDVGEPSDPSENGVPPIDEPETAEPPEEPPPTDDEAGSEDLEPSDGLGGVDESATDDELQSTEERVEEESVTLPIGEPEDRETREDHHKPDASKENLSFRLGGRGPGRSVVWNPNYRKFQPWQVGVLISASAALVTASLVQREPEEARWTNAGPFDEFVASRLGIRSPEEVNRFRLVSDILYGIVTPLPIVLDGTIMLPLVRQSPEVAAQVLLIDLQSFAFTSVVYFGFRAIARRARPELVRCIDRNGEENCLDVRSPNYSFFSGHSALAFTGAGLMCTHQRYLNVYRNDRVGASICGISMAAAGVAATCRILSNRHWASDVFAGTAVGLFSGLVLPRLIHFSPPRLRRLRSRPAFVFAYPTFPRDGVGIRVMSVF